MNDYSFFSAPQLKRDPLDGADTLMLAFDDPRWTTLEGGYRVTYDPRPALRRLESSENPTPIWEELWNELHHQGDVGPASYASVPILVDMRRRLHRLDWNFYALVATIEIERHRQSNPPIPDWLLSHYQAAWRELLELALADLKATANPYLVQAALAVVAVGKGALKLGALLNHLDTSELDDLLDEQLRWTDLYRGAV